MQDAASALARLCAQESQVSAHYVVDEAGEIYQLVAEEHRAWHAGVSHWRGRDNLNDFSVGIEIVNPGHEFGYRPFPQTQMEAVAQLSLAIIKRHDIPVSNILGHSDIAPARKQDPGELFAWKWLAEQGVGYFPVSSGELMASEKLADYGYATHLNSLVDVIKAFQRRFRPAAINGEWDDECAGLLGALLGNY